MLRKTYTLTVCIVTFFLILIVLAVRPSQSSSPKALFDIPVSKPANVPRLLHQAKLIDRYDLLTRQLLTSHQNVTSQPILILQHVAGRTPLHLASIATHRIYAQIQKYEYRAVYTDYIPRPKYRQEKSMNKLYTLRDAMSEELSGEEGMEWIFLTDADTLIYNPLISLSDILPPIDLERPAYILGNQDYKGFNAGVMFFRVNEQVLSWLNGIIDTYESAAKVTHDVITDQLLLQQALMQSEVGSHFYEIPKGWTNAYWPNEHWEGVQIQIHLVNRLKETISWISMLEESISTAEGFMERSGDRGRSESVNREVREMTQAAARRWWEQARPGVEGMKLLWDY